MTEGMNMLNSLRDMKKRADVARPLVEALCTQAKPAEDILIQVKKARTAGMTIPDKVLEVAVQRAVESHAASGDWARCVACLGVTNASSPQQNQ